MKIHSEPTNFHIVCINKSAGIIKARDEGVKIFCLEEVLEDKAEIKGSSQLLKNTQTQEYIKKNTPQGTTPNVIFFKITPDLEEICDSLNYKVLNTTAALNQMFEQKLSQYEKLKDAGVNFPTSMTGSLNQFSFKEISRELGLPFVIQYNRGHSGSGTLFIKSEEEFNNELMKYPSRTAKFSAKIIGEAWTLNACVSRFGIAYGGLSYQITGIKECTTKEGGTVGNDWSLSSTLSHDTIKQIEHITINAGRVMQNEQYRGFYGIDLIINKSGKVYLIEINARQPASTSMHTKLMLTEEKVPLQALHIAEFLFSEDENSQYLQFLNEVLIKNAQIHSKPMKQISGNNIAMIIKQQNESEMASKSAAQLFIRNIFKKDIIAKLSLITGVYSYNPDTEQLEYQHEGYSIEDIKNKDDFLILAAESGKIISPESELARIQTLSSLLDSDTKKIKENVLKIVKYINKNDRKN
jgi:biotin carboxylase